MTCACGRGSTGEAAGLDDPVAVQEPSCVPDVVVRILGPVDVLGAARPFSRAWTLDLVVYLAMHPKGAPGDVWSTALWPDRAVADATRHSTVSVARRALGRDRQGRDHLPRCKGRLALGPAVTTDWERFQALAATTGASAPTAWESALDLVRGRPFDGLRALDWAVLEGVQAAIEDGVVQVALRLARHHLDQGDGWAAERAARRALVMCPYDERLYRAVMRAADHQGNPGGVERAMAELSRVVGGDIGGGPGPRGRAPVDAIPWAHPDTVSVYRLLSRHAAGRDQPLGQAHGSTRPRHRLARAAGTGP